MICQGCWSLVEEDLTWGRQDLRDSVEAIEAALAAGVNFFDTAEGYGAGQSEEILGRALRPRRKDVIIATKVSSRHLKGDALKRQCEASLRRLQTDYIDLYQIHWPSPAVPLDETLGAMGELVDAGKVRAVGVSNFGVSYLREALAAGRVESNQLAYSLLWRPIECEVQPLCFSRGLSILTYSSLAQGLLTGKFASADDVPSGRARTRIFSKDRPHARHEDAGCEKEVFEALAEIRKTCDSLGRPMAAVSAAWLLAQPGVTSVIVGGRNARQAAQNAEAGDLELPTDVIDKLADATEAIKAHAGGNADMWQSESRMER